MCTYNRWALKPTYEKDHQEKGQEIFKKTVEIEEINAAVGSVTKKKVEKAFAREGVSIDENH